MTKRITLRTLGNAQSLKADDAARGEHPVDVEEVEKRVVEGVPTVDVGELDGLAVVDQLRERQVVDTLDQSVMAIESGPLQVEHADVAPMA